MRALLQADRSAMGRNVVDLRGVLVDRLEERLDRLEDTHREVLAAAYENVAGMNQVHRACLALLEPADFAGFLKVLTCDIAPILDRRGDPARPRGAGGRAGRRPRAGGAVPGRGGGAAGGRCRCLPDPGARPRGAAGDAAPAGQGLARRLRRRGAGDPLRGAAPARPRRGQPRRRCSPSPRATRGGSTPSRAPTSSTSSAGSSSAACGAGWHERPAPSEGAARLMQDWLAQLGAVRGASPRTLDRLPERRRGLPRVSRRALGRAGRRGGAGAGLDRRPPGLDGARCAAAASRPARSRGRCRR